MRLSLEQMLRQMPRIMATITASLYLLHGNPFLTQLSDFGYNVELSGGMTVSDIVHTRG